MNRTEFEQFITKNKLKKKDVAQFLGVSSAFITALCSGARPVPINKIDLIKSNPKWDTSMLGEGNMLKDQSVSTNSDNTNQLQNDMTIQELLEAIKRRDQQMDEMLSQQGRLISIIESMSGATIKQSHAG